MAGGMYGLCVLDHPKKLWCECEESLESFEFCFAETVPERGTVIEKEDAMLALLRLCLDEGRKSGSRYVGDSLVLERCSKRGSKGAVIWR